MDFVKSMYRIEYRRMKRNFTHINDGTTEYELGSHYYLELNYEKAVDMFMRAASSGNAMAHHAMGIMAFNGYGVPKNTEMAVKWWRASERLGYSRSDLEF
jgi:TPR repeat protein